MRKSRRQFVDGKFGQIHVRVAAPEKPQHPPMICLHMFPQSGRNFYEFIEHCCNDRMVLAPDFPGHGESDPPESPIVAEEYAETVWQVVDQLGLLEQYGQIDLFGIHAGAKLAVEAAYQHPSKVRKIVLSSAAVLKPEEIEALRQQLLSKIPLDQAGTRFSTIWQRVVDSQGDHVSLELAAIAFAEILRGGEQYNWGHAAVFEYNHSFAERLPTLAHPILLLNPNDGLYEQTPRSLEYMQNAELINLPDYGLSYISTHAAQIAPVITSFLDREDQAVAHDDVDQVTRHVAR